MSSASTVFTIIGVILALAATIVAWIMIVPENKRPKLNKFFQYLHDLFNFKSLWLEKILKFLYIFETLTCVIVGFVWLFNFSSYSGIYGRSHVTWNGWIGLLLMIFGPIINRIIYEFLLMLVLLVKNTMDINDKLNAQPGSRYQEKLAEAQRREEEAAARRAEKEAEKAAYAQQQYMQQQYAQQQQQQQQQLAQQQYEQYGQQYEQQRYDQQYPQQNMQQNPQPEAPEANQDNNG